MAHTDAHKHFHPHLEEVFQGGSIKDILYLLIQSEENQHASGTKNCLNLPTLFFKREHTHMANTKPMWTQAQKPNVSSMKCFSRPAFQCGDASLKVKI